MTDGQPKFVIDMIYEGEHDLRSWINNLSGSKRTWKNLGEPWLLQWPDASLYQLS